MIVCKCLAKERDSSGRIVRYALQDASNHICIIGAYELKTRIQYREVDVINLKLTSDGRLVDSQITGPLKINETDKFEYTKYLNEREFMSANSYALDNRPEALHGWMDDDEGVYKESISGLDGGVLEVGKLSWGVTLQPERSQRIGVWVNHGWYISGPTIERFAENMKKAYAKALDKMEANPLDTWEIEGPQDTGFYLRHEIMGGSYVSVWPRHSRIWLNNENELNRFLDKLLGLEQRVREVREIKGWRSKKEGPTMNPDGTINTKGNWFNKFFGKR